jgi:dihydroxy-acid dehydratase
LPPRGLARNTSNYGDRDFARYLRRSFARSIGCSQAMLDRPAVGIVDTGLAYNNCHRTVPELIEAVKRGVLANYSSRRMPASIPVSRQAKQSAFGALRG